MSLPELDPAIMYKVDRYGSSFWAAVNASEGERALSPLERRRAKLWLGRAQGALVAAAGVEVAVESSADASEGEATFASRPAAN